MKKFREKKYPRSLTDAAYQRAAELTQNECISPKKKQTRTNNECTNNNFKHAFITGYNSNHKTIKNIISKYWFILKNYPHLEKIMADRPCVIYRRARTLKNVLAPSRLKKTRTDKINHSCGTVPRIGSFRCNKERCKCCSIIMHNTSEVQSFTTKKVFQLRNFLDCGSDNVIYVIVCSCGLQYVGKTTQPLRVRMNNHRFRHAQILLHDSRMRSGVTARAWYT